MKNAPSSSLPVMVQEISVGQLLAVRGMNNEWVTCRVIAYTKGNSLNKKVFIEAVVEPPSRIQRGSPPTPFTHDSGEIDAAVADGRCGDSEQDRAQWCKENLS